MLDLPAEIPRTQACSLLGENRARPLAAVIRIMRHWTLFLTLFSAAVLPRFPARSQPIHQGTLAGKQNSGPLPVTLSKDQTVSYLIEFSSSYYYGASVTVEGFNHKGTSLFTRSAYTGMAGNVITVTLPAGIGHLVPYRGTAHQIGRPAYLVVTSLNSPVTYSVFESKDDRQDYNKGGLSMGEAKTIALYETVKGNVHEIEGNDVKPGDRPSPGGQWFKVTLEPRQAIRPHGWALGHPTNGASFFVRLYDESGAHLKTIANVAAYGLVAFPNAQGVGSSVYQNAATEPKTFYVQVYSKLFITHDFEFSLVEVMMKFKIMSQTIEKANNYSENTEVEVQAIRGDTRVPLADFGGNVGITEINGNTYTQNGGSLPLVVQIPPGSGGKATFIAKSLVGPGTGGKGKREPPSAEIRCVTFRQTVDSAPVDEPLKIKQWFYTKQIHDRSTGEVPDWLQARVKDLFEHPNLTDADRAALDAVESYSIEDLGDMEDGEVSIERRQTLPLKLNPFRNKAMRLNSPLWIGLRCGTSLDLRRFLTSILFHEARHCYQGSQAYQISKNADLDFLINTPYEHAPTDAPVDSTGPRTVCDGGILQSNWTNKGDSNPDELGPPDHSDWGLELDAEYFGMLLRPY